ncbi:phosphoribosyltransferase [Rariglobus hedericola]|uniref:Phosphoribosyltransferase n=1 Tax=Rariglobus hedericola TaxID=2597822 RepID=A0A556QMS8_9BACT|nr:phosphoribosyltransferase family protein [Rariglobus hedericola]TSJ77927.1 phosphoribosyltransferase [Rariglobus hedericola]
MSTIPAHLDLLYPPEAIEEQLVILSAQLDTWAAESKAETGKLLLCICLLRGGAFFFSDLLLRMRQSVEPAFCRARSYDKNTNKPLDNIEIDWQSTKLAGRDIVLFDNICDSGRTFKEAAGQLLAQGARSVRSVSMVYRVRPDSLHTPDLTGFTFAGKEWLVGYGLRDHGDLLMNTRVIYTARDTSY